MKHALGTHDNIKASEAGVGSFNQAGAEKAVRDLLVAIGEDPSREGLRETPQRVARFYKEWFSGVKAAEPTTFHAAYDEMVIVKDIPFYSLCEHHLLPFFGKAHVGYLPKGRIIGLSKITRLVHRLANRLQVQEHLTVQIADDLMNALDPRGVMVLLEAEHLCMSMRGTRTPHTATVTSALRGAFRDEKRGSRRELLSLVKETR